MKLTFWKKRRRYRGKGKGAEAKLKEERAKTDSYLARLFRQQLESNPELAMRIAEAKFGHELALYPSDGDPTGLDSLIEQLKKLSEMRTLLQDEFEGRQESVTEILTKALAPLFPQIIPQLVKDLRPSQSPRQEPPEVHSPRIIQIESESETPLPGMSVVPELPQAKRAQAQSLPGIGAATPETSRDREEAIFEYLDWALGTASVEQVAASLFAFKGNSLDFRGIIWEQLTTRSLEEIIELLPIVLESEEYIFLEPYRDRIDPEWLKKLFDYVQELNKYEPPVSTSG